MDKYVNKVMVRSFVTLLVMLQIASAQDYKMRMSSISAMANNVTYSEGWWDAGIHLVGSLGLPVITKSSGAGIGLASGFWVVTQGFYLEPPIVEQFVIMDPQLQVGQGVNVMAKFSDFNGILSAKIHVNVGGMDSTMAFPMVRNDSSFTAFIPD